VIEKGDRALLRLIWGLIVFGVLAMVSAWAFPAHAGTMSLEWDTVDHPNLASYRVFYEIGTVSESSTPLDVALPTTSVVLLGLDDCAEYHASVQSVHTDGSLSGWPQDAGGSNIVIRGWPLVTIDSVTYAGAGLVQIAGNNIGPIVTVLVDDVVVTPLSVACDRVELAELAGARVEIRTTQANGDTLSASYDIPLQAPASLWRRIGALPE